MAEELGLVDETSEEFRLLDEESEELGSVDVESALSYFKENLEDEIHICENESRYKLTKNALQSGQILHLLTSMKDIYDKCKEDAENFACFMMKYFGTCGENYANLVEKSADSKDMLAVYNYCSHCVFSAGQIAKIKETEIAKCRTPVSPGTVQDTVKPLKPETERGLLSLGGGTLGEIWRVNKRLKSSQTLSDKQKKWATSLYKLTFVFRMSTEDKLVAELAPSMIERDSGGMFIPKTEFVPFIRSAIDTVMLYANEENYKKYGKNLLKACTAEVQSRLDIYQKFQEAVDFLDVDLDQDYSQNDLEEFFKVWLRKLTHARLGEFIRGKGQKDVVKKGGRLKGGHTLRDTLYALTAKKTETSEKSRQCSGKSKHKRRRIELDSKGKQNNQTLGNTTPSVRVRREILKPKKFANFDME